jgi:hypothetical protein
MSASEPTMHLFYFDESGDSGHPALVNSPTRFFVLSAVVVHQDVWLAVLDKLITLRRDLRTRHGIPTRPEIKSQHIRPGRDIFRGLPMTEADRLALYRDLMRFQESTLTEIKCFCVAIDKAKILKRQMDIRETAWTYALQRVDSICKEASDKAVIFPDEGHAPLIRRLIRRLRRFHSIRGHFGGLISIPTERIVEDPNDRKSHDSYLVQLADWNALACHRSRYLDPTPRMLTDLWDQMPSRHLREVNELTGGPPGIVVWPR